VAPDAVPQSPFKPHPQVTIRGNLVKPPREIKPAPGEADY